MLTRNAPRLYCEQMRWLFCCQHIWLLYVNVYVPVLVAWYVNVYTTVQVCCGNKINTNRNEIFQKNTIMNALEGCRKDFSFHFIFTSTLNLSFVCIGFSSAIYVRVFSASSNQHLVKYERTNFATCFIIYCCTEELGPVRDIQISNVGCNKIHLSLSIDR